MPRRAASENQAMLPWPCGSTMKAASKGPMAWPALPPTWKIDCANPCWPPDASRATRELSGWNTDEPMPPIPLHHIPKASFNVSLDPARTFAMTRLPMHRLRAVRRATGTTLNDVYLAVCAGAMRTYLEERGELPGRPLVASVPVSTDPDAARLSGNRVDNIYVAIGTDVADPAARLARIHDGVRASKEVRGALGHDLLEQRADVEATDDVRYRPFLSLHLILFLPPSFSSSV